MSPSISQDSYSKQCNYVLYHIQQECSPLTGHECAYRRVPTVRNSPVMSLTGYKCMPCDVQWLAMNVCLKGPESPEFPYNIPLLSLCRISDSQYLRDIVKEHHRKILEVLCKYKFGFSLVRFFAS